MKIFAKNKIKGYEDKSAWAEEYKAIFDTPKLRMSTGRYMFRIINKSRIRVIMEKAKYS